MNQRQQHMRDDRYLENVETDVAVLIHIGVEARSVEFDRWRLEGVVGGEFQRQFVRQALVHRTLAALDGANP